MSKSIFIKERCKECDGVGVYNIELKVGDIVTPIDGSSMNGALHSLTWRGAIESGFKDVKIVSIQGEMLGVEPVDWNNRKFDSDMSLGYGSIWEESIDELLETVKFNNKTIRQVTQFGFWIHYSMVKLKKVNIKEDSFNTKKILMIKKIRSVTNMNLPESKRLSEDLFNIMQS